MKQWISWLFLSCTQSSTLCQLAGHAKMVGKIALSSFETRLFFHLSYFLSLLQCLPHFGNPFATTFCFASSSSNRIVTKGSINCCGQAVEGKCQRQNIQIKSQQSQSSAWWLAFPGCDCLMATVKRSYGFSQEKQVVPCTTNNLLVWDYMQWWGDRTEAWDTLLANDESCR